MSSRRRKHPVHEEEHDNEERWLVSYADMMTLLFCLFMVLFAISSVNTSKFEALQQALQDAFSGKILSGGKAVMETGSQEPTEPAPPEPPLPAIQPLAALNNTTESASSPAAAEAAKREQEEFKRLKQRIDALAKAQGLSANVHTEIRRAGLVIELLTDRVFFSSGSATLEPAAGRVLAQVGGIVAAERRHPIVVEGHTDSQPIATGQYPSNWQLSGARAAAVVQNFAADGVNERRMSLSGYAAERPKATNSTPEGRARNRRVDIVLSRLYPNATADAGRRP
jgi:chemotaxis protein MotB